MPEQISLAVPVITSKTRTTWGLSSLAIDRDRGLVSIYLKSDDGNTLLANYPTPGILGPGGSLQPSGAQLLQTLNTANLTSNSLVKRVLSRLITDGYIVGIVTGTPD